MVTSGRRYFGRDTETTKTLSQDGRGDVQRDIEGAFNSIFIHPDLSRLTIAELDGHILGSGENVMVSHPVLGFGWISGPYNFQLFGIDMQAKRESYGMGDVGWPGSSLPKSAALPFF